jgi:3-(3-hydroxy-phenyl)propionate hydroxylase
MPTIVRSRVYMHHSRIAETFQLGKVFLGGDAAHLQPPFFGQGMNSGIRDATNLAWKLAAVVSGRASEPILETYDAERRGHAAEMVSFATRIGQMYSPRNRLTERARDLGFRIVQLIPGGKEYILQMKYKPMPRYTTGIVVGARRRPTDDPVGRMFPQPAVETRAHKREKLDDVVGPWFSVIGIHLDPSQHLAQESLTWWRSLGARFVRVDAPRSGALPTAAGQPAPVETSGTQVVVEDVDGAFRDWLLARPGHEIIVLRPDRYVAAVCGRPEFEATTQALRNLIGGGEQRRAG